MRYTAPIFGAYIPRYHCSEEHKSRAAKGTTVHLVQHLVLDNDQPDGPGMPREQGVAMAAVLRLPLASGTQIASRSSHLFFYYIIPHHSSIIGGGPSQAGLETGFTFSVFLGSFGRDQCISQGHLETHCIPVLIWKEFVPFG